MDAYRRPGQDRAWALITGAGAGMGLAAGKELLERGFGVILLGSVEDELREAKSSLDKSHPGDVVSIVVMNAQTATAEELVALVDSIKHLNITILMNHVGANPVQPPMRELHTYSVADVDAVIDTNMRFMARLTALMLPILSRQPVQAGGRSLILNTSSGGKVGLPWLVMYSSSKAFVQSFSHSLARELEVSAAARHVDCLCLIPGDVLSKSNHTGVLPTAPLAEDYGRWIIRAVDGPARRGMRDMTPYWKHDLQIRALPWMGESIKKDALLKVVMSKKKAWEDYYQKAS